MPHRNLSAHNPKRIAVARFENRTGDASLAVFEASSRRLLPPKYASMTPEDLDRRMRHLRLTVGGRR